MSAVNGKRQAAWFGIEPGSDRGAAGAEGLFAGVVFNRPVDQVFTYRVPERLREGVRPGQRLTVPLGKGDKPAVGYCVRLDEGAPDGVALSKIKEVVSLIDDP